MIAARCVTLKLSGSVIRLPFGSRASLAIAFSISESSCTGIGFAVIPKAGAAASIALLNLGAIVVSGLKMVPTRVIPGAISLSNSSHFPTSGASNEPNPVIVPPGRARL